MIYNKKFNTYPILAHAPGLIKFIPLWFDLLYLENLFRKKQKPPNNLTVVTFNNNLESGHNDKKTGLFERNIETNVLGQNIIEWKNSYKIPLLLNFLEKVTTDFVLICDSSDVFVLSDLSNIIEKFKNMNCSACFNAEVLQQKNIDQNIIDYENEIQCNLNAGAWIGYTKFAKNFVYKCNQLTKKYNYSSEQWYYKNIFFEHRECIKIDKNCSIFQGLNRIDREEIELIKPYL